MGSPFKNPLTVTIVEFLTGIGLSVRAGEIHETTFLPGIQIEHGILVIDESKLAYPGDLLHEAGHMAVVPAERRAKLHLSAGKNAGEEMMAIAWSYAAALHIGLDPAVVFHEGGYKGGGSSILENFREGRTFGVPGLQWIGLSAEPRRAADFGMPAYPNMSKWLSD